MDPAELERLRRHYATLSDAALAGALACGQEGYAAPAIWAIIVEEARERGLAPPSAVAVEADALVGGAVPFGDRPGEGERYAVFAHPDGRRAAVKRGFCWPGFFFTWIWAAAKGMGDWTGGLLAGAVVVMALGRSGDATLALLALVGEIGLKVWVGRQGNAARERTLRTSRYVLLGTLPATTPDDALAKAAAITAAAEITEPAMAAPAP